MLLSRVCPRLRPTDAGIGSSYHLGSKVVLNKWKDGWSQKSSTESQPVPSFRNSLWYEKSKVDLNTWHHFTKHWSSWDGSNISLWWSSGDMRLARGPVGDQKCCWEEKCEEYPTYSSSLPLRPGSRETGVLRISCVLGSVELHQMMVQFVTHQVDFVGFLPW